MALAIAEQPFKPTFIAKQLARIALRDEPDGVWRCRYCRREVVRTDLSLSWSTHDLWPERDHVIPRSRALSCQRCNVSKGDLLLSELPEGWPHVPASHPNRSGRWRQG
jgi:hypothetical protein